MSRILLSAYACEPGKGSEAEVGWLWGTELEAAGHEVWVITREANRRAIEDAPTTRSKPGLHFVYYDLPQWILNSKHGGRGVHWYYALWQWGAYRLARRLMKTARFDCVQHVTFVGLRAPSFMGRLGLPFVLGPVSGGECVPALLRKGLSNGARLRELARDAANRLVKADPTLRHGFRNAETILVATAESQALIPRAFRDKCQVQLGVGLSREYLGWTGLRKKSVGGGLRLLYAGRLLEWKGVDLALRALRQMKDRDVAAIFTVVGAGAAERSLKTLAAELDISDAVRWVPWVSHAELDEHYYQHDALLFPSLRDSGGMVVLEALAHGLPVVCTDLGGPGVIVNERCGRVVATGGRVRAEIVSELTGALLELSCDRVLLHKLSRAARTRAWQFDFQEVVTQLHPVATVEARL